MSKAPERIWVAPDGGDIIIHNGKPNLDTLIAAGHISEYVRADRIEKLEADLHLMETSGIVEVSVRNPSVMEYMKHWETRAETAEAKLAELEPKDGRPCATDEFLAVILDELDDSWNIFYAIKDWVEGDWVSAVQGTTIAELSSVSCANSKGKADE